jgi:hypothetical protein
MDWAPSPWDAERIERLRVLWFDGWSASECGAFLGCSRNAVIGQAHRLGWSHMPRRQRPPTSKARRLLGPTLPFPEPPESPPKPKRVRKPRPQMPQMRPDLRPRDPPIGSFTLLDLRHGQCRWPEGERPPFRYCGARVLEFSSYCEPHHSRAHHGPPVARGTPSYLRWAVK